MSIADALTGHSLLITGVTGSVGSVLLEKVLRSCPGVNKVFVLVRDGGNETAQQRFDKLFTAPLFSLLLPTCIDKVQVISGDVTLQGLGLNLVDHETLVNHVTLVFHVAAKVAFSCSLKSAVAANLIGTKNVLQLSHRIKNIQGLIYVSTAYSNCIVKEISERLYPVTCDPEDVIDLVMTLSDPELEKITPKLLEHHPNTYTFSKQLAEHLLASQRGHIKVAIVRPSIVLGTWKEPFPGWLVVNSGNTGFIAGACKGVFRSVSGDARKVADMIPSDVVVNMLLAAAWSLLQPGSLSLQIYHVTSGARNPLTWGQYAEYLVRAFHHFPGRILVWYPALKCRSKLWRSQLSAVLYQLWPSYVLDFAENITNLRHNKYKTESLARIQHKFIRGMECTHYFSKQQWRFHNDNTLALLRNLTQEDRSMLSVEQLDWKCYLADCVLGVRKFYFRDPEQTLPQARRNLHLWRLVHHSIPVIFLIAVFLVMTSLSIFSDNTTYLTIFFLVIFLRWF